MSDDLASDSEDEKRMKTAENRALLKMKSSRKKKYSDGPSYDYDETPKKPFTKLHASFGTPQIHSRLYPSGRPSFGKTTAKIPARGSDHSIDVLPLRKNWSLEKRLPCQPNASKEKLKVKYNLDLCYENQPRSQGFLPF